METPPEGQKQRLVIAIDYGTTYTGVAIATPTSDKAVLGDIDIILDWGPGMGNHKKIPSVISYSLRSRNNENQTSRYQWGTNLSPEAVAMVHTKLQLDVDNTSTELDLILQALDGMHNLDFQYIIDSGSLPKYPRQGPEEIVEDYLTEVFKAFRKSKVMAKLTEAYLKETPVDIVATIPAKWGYKAKNSTFRALWRAGFNNDKFPQLKDMLLVSEPEAAAIYTARVLREENGVDFFRKGECFVLCDAGGGTVDVVSYKVKKLQPTFELERVTIPTGDKCGAIFINLAFKEWLRDLIGEDKYQELDQSELVHKISSHDSEGERMRELMKRFDVHKRRFERGHRDIKIDLPEPYENLDMDTRVIGGQITIAYSTMQSFFERCATPIVELIQNQVEEIERRRSRLQHVLLVGGFAESKYLQSSIEESLHMRGLKLRVPDTSWTAVVRGAAIFGIEKSSSKALSTMDPSPLSYGISVNAPFSDVEGHNTQDRVVDELTNTAMAKEQLIWMINQGDLILSNKPKESKGTFSINFLETGLRTGTIPIYAYDQGDRDDRPDRLSISENELTKFYEMHYDLTGISTQELRRYTPTPPSPPYYVAPLTLTMKLTPQEFHVELHCKDRVICSTVKLDNRVIVLLSNLDPDQVEERRTLLSTINIPSREGSLYN